MGAKWGAIIRRHETIHGPAERSRLVHDQLYSDSQPCRASVRISFASRESVVQWLTKASRTVAWWFAETTAVGHRAIDAVFFHLNIGEGNEIQGSQVGSHR